MQVAMMLYEGFRLLDVTGPMDVFHAANRLRGATLYEQHLVGPSSEPVSCSNGVAVSATESRSDVRTSFDIVVVPGAPAVGPPPAHLELVDWLRDAGRRTGRVASVSNGAFLIARAGLADHRALTTHQRDAQRLATEFPLVHVISHQRYLKDGNLHSSRGVSDGIRLALALVEEDLGDEFARSVDRSMSGRRSWLRYSGC